MPNLAVNDVVRIRHVFYYQDIYAYNLKCYAVTSVVGTATLLSAVQAINNVVSPSMLACTVQGVQYVGTYGRVIKPLPFSTEEHVLTPGAAGSASPPAMPSQCSVLFRLRTAYIGRRMQGRLYLPFCSLAGRVGGQSWSAGYFGTLGSCAAALRAVVTAPGPFGICSLAPVIWHRDTAGWDFIVNCTVSQAIASQRRRGQLQFPRTPQPYAE